MKNDIKMCSCGHTKDHVLVIAKTRYNKFGLFLLSLAYSAKPLEVVFQCQQCGEIIERSSDPELLKKFRFNSDIIR